MLLDLFIVRRVARQVAVFVGRVMRIFFGVDFLEPKFLTFGAAGRLTVCLAISVVSLKMSSSSDVRRLAGSYMLLKDMFQISDCEADCEPF